jgi:hypothetical protein
MAQSPPLRSVVFDADLGRRQSSFCWDLESGWWGRPPLASSAGWFGPAEADSSVVGVSVDLEASLVDDDVMVEPAEGYQIIGIGRPAF